MVMSVDYRMWVGIGAKTEKNLYLLYAHGVSINNNSFYLYKKNIIIL